MEDGRLMGLISFVVGMTLGANWGKIKKFLPKAKKSVAQFVEDTKDKVAEVASSATEAVVNLSENATEAVSDTAKKLFHTPTPVVKRAVRAHRKARAVAHA